MRYKISRKVFVLGAIALLLMLSVSVTVAGGGYTIPWWTGDQAIFGYALGLTHGDDPWDVSARLPVTLAGKTANPPGSQPIDNHTLLPIIAFHRLAGLPVPKTLAILDPSTSLGTGFGF